jgi:hypothetical protein
MTHGRPILRATAIALLATLAVLCPASLVAGLDRAWEAMLYGVVAAGYLLVGLTIMERRPDNRIGALAFGLGAGLSIVIVATIYAGLPGPPPGHGLAAWTASILDAPVYAAGALLFLLFPTGRLPSRRWAFVAIPAAIPAVLEASTRALAPGPFPLFPTIDNPLGIDGFPTELGGDALVSESIVALAVFVTPTVLAFLAPVARWPGASRIERAQLKWIGAAAVINVFALAVYIVVAEAGGFTRMGDLAVGIGAAASRSRSGSRSIGTGCSTSIGSSVARSAGASSPACSAGPSSSSSSDSRACSPS